MKNFLIASLALFNTVEGVAHLVTAGISIWGCYDTGVWDWRVLANPVTDIGFGLFSILTGWFLGQGLTFHVHAPHDHKH